VPAHEFKNANRNAVAPYMQTFNLPLRWELASTAITGTGGLQAICADVESEGGVGSPNGFHFTAANTADVSTSTARKAAIAIRPRATYNGVVNRMVILPEDVVAIVASQSHLIEIVYNPVLGGGTWAPADPSSGVEVGIGHTVTGGTKIDSFFLAASASARTTGTARIDSQYPVTLDAAGANPRAIAVVVSTFTGTGTARAAINWKEIR
jgi:hypothetical protein